MYKTTRDKHRHTTTDEPFDFFSAEAWSLAALSRADMLADQGRYMTAQLHYRVADALASMSPGAELSRAGVFGLALFLGVDADHANTLTTCQSL